MPELDLSPARKLPRSARDRLVLYENGLREGIRGLGVTRLDRQVLRLAAQDPDDQLAVRQRGLHATAEAAITSTSR